MTKKFLLYAAALAAFAATPAVLWASSTEPTMKCRCVNCCHHHPQAAPTSDAGKGNQCKAHPASCR